ncbi:MAG: hypothetical protein SGARI_003524 [Bacillariaceae sp.]
MPSSMKWPLGTKVQKYFPGYGSFEDFAESDVEQHLYLQPSVATTPPHSKRNAMATPTKLTPSHKRLKWEDGDAAVVTPQSTTNATATSSFGALYSKDVPIHTLIVGTYPATESFAQREYFARSTNAFWWIAGDCLGFRRNGGERLSGDGCLGLCKHLRFGKEHSISYQQQVDIFCSKGFALWDVLATCKRKGSLDSAIQSGSDIPNNIRGFVKQHPSIRRIVFASGKSTARYFNMHFKDWWMTGELTYSGDHPYSVEMFGKMMFDNRGNQVTPNNNAIVCVVAKSVSPADANTTYIEKRQFWENHVYGPGLEMHK